MQALVYDARENIALKDVPVPVPKAGDVLIKVKYAGICGSDLHAWHGGFPRIQSPVILGHEMTGSVLQCGEGVPEGMYKEGVRVVAEPIISCGECLFCVKGEYNRCEKMKVIGLDMDGGFAEYCAVPYIRLHKVPDALDDLTAALCEPFAVAIHMAQRVNLSLGDSVLITGAGPIGLALAWVAREAGANVTLTEISPKRIDTAQSFGFNVIDVGHGAGHMPDTKADVGFEVSGAPSSLDLLIHHTRRGGSILAGAFIERPAIDLHTLTLHELNLVGSRMYSAGVFPKALNLLQKPGFEGKKMITAVLDLKDIVTGFEDIANGEPAVKTIIKIS